MPVNFEIIGSVTFIGDTIEVTAKFRKRIMKVFVRNEKNDKYSDLFQIEFMQDRCDRLDDFKVNDIVNCKCSVSGRDWISKDGSPITDKDGNVINSTTINCWHIRNANEKDTSGEAKQNIDEQESYSQDINDDMGGHELDDDDPPF